MIPVRGDVALTEIKLVAAVLVLLAGVAGGMFASRLSHWQGSALLASLANTFAGGVFLGAAFLHMLPDAIENFKTFVPEDGYPLFALVGAFAFLTVLLMDKVVMPSGSQGLTRKGSIYPYLLMVTLSVHSVITGLALGLEQARAGFIAILIAVLAHKSTAAMALTISFNHEHVDQSRVRPLLAVFYVMTPLGILTGTWFASFLAGEVLVVFEAVFDAMAAGTFFYIAVMDILSEEFQDSSGRWSRFAMAIAGFAVMALVAVWA